MVGEKHPSLIGQTNLSLVSHKNPSLVEKKNLLWLVRETPPTLVGKLNRQKKQEKKEKFKEKM